MAELRRKSIQLTGYLERLLLSLQFTPDLGRHFKILTPSNPHERGAQLSVKLSAGLLDPVMHALEAKGIIVDERRPDVIRVAPAPLYNSFEDVWNFGVGFRASLIEGVARVQAEGLSGHEGKPDARDRAEHEEGAKHGWGLIK